MQKVTLIVLFLFVLSINGATVTVTNDFTTRLHESKLIPTFQVVLNPLVQRGSKIHDNVWKYVGELDTDIIRFQAWLLFPKLVVLELERADCQKNGTSWNFSYMDPMLQDFMNATANKVSSINFCTTPAWMWKTNGPVPYPSDPSVPDWTYGYQGTQLVDPTFQEIADYHARIYNWYTKGSFVDECQRTWKNPNPPYTFDYFEILNEIDLEHQISPEYYTQIYDAVVSSIQKIDNKVKFIGLALAHGIDGAPYLQYFLNSSNHKPGIPLDMISYHHYSFPQYNDTDMWGTVLSTTQAFLDEVVNLEKIRQQLSPQTEVNIEEFGIIVGTGRELNPPPLPNGYWNFAAAQYGYAFAWLSNLGGINALGMSQFVGYPGNFPSLPMIDWTDGKVNARYWALRIIIDQLGHNHGKRKITVFKSSSSNSDIIYSSAFIVLDYGQSERRKVLLVSKTISETTVTIANINGGDLYYVDMRTGPNGEPVHERIQGETITLGGYAVAIVAYPMNVENK